MDVLPRDLVVYIAKMLDINSLCKFRLSAKRYNQTLRGERFWLAYNDIGQPWPLVKVKTWWLSKLAELQEHASHFLAIYFNNYIHIEITLVSNEYIDVTIYKQADTQLELITRIYRKPISYFQVLLANIIRYGYWEGQSYGIPDCASYTIAGTTHFLWYDLK